MRDHLRTVRLRAGRNVQRLRLLRKLTQEELSELVENSTKHIGQVERGEVNVGIDILSKIAGALSVDVADLFIEPRRRRAPEPKVFLITGRELDQVEQLLRRVRAVRSTRQSARGRE